MLEENIRKKIHKILLSDIGKLQKLGFTANKITALSCFSAIAAAFLFYSGYLILGGVFVILDYIFDGLDGVLAEVSGTISRRGYLFDHLSDFVVRRVWYFALVLGGFLSYELVSFAIFTFSMNIFLINLAIIKKLKVPKWSLTIVDWLIIPAVFTQEVTFYFTLMIVVHIILFVVNTIYISYMNK